MACHLSVVKISVRNQSAGCATFLESPYTTNDHNSQLTEKYRE
ncbi:hypothetical protein ACZ87_03347 [Candidatus Erwinia dacicola]|uniref:Uncharacterized protein n=1 Tax=Candidatus Erwinia dacicola TaxID=252393 RepID=A0A328TH74_9GAMM|nr:hypothetical protein ACZ87_03347 [Candidatus Erwinia dacicola]